MDGLSKNHATILCFEQKVVVKQPRDIELLSALKARKLLKSEGCRGFLMAIITKEDEVLKVSDVNVVQKFLDIFRNDLNMMPPEREVEFTIDLVPSLHQFLRPFIG
ncbi:unnamed protein product [Fraxinus pennsylvanica]|uniref:Uncharacterized protein n=1 Tax=Fraxinus pennsylvanica TaxID=56036 RepID=A0AAD2DZV9_9LAMI|nr:unnamed protein product [Fraxinus pennsylvanica]